MRSHGLLNSARFSFCNAFLLVVRIETSPYTFFNLIGVAALGWDKFPNRCLNTLTDSPFTCFVSSVSLFSVFSVFLTRKLVSEEMLIHSVERPGVN